MLPSSTISGVSQTFAAAWCMHLMMPCQIMYLMIRTSYHSIIIIRGVSYHVVSARASNDVPTTAPSTCLGTLCQDKKLKLHFYLQKMETTFFPSSQTERVLSHWGHQFAFPSSRPSSSLHSYMNQNGRGVWGWLCSPTPCCQRQGPPTHSPWLSKVHKDPPSCRHCCREEGGN